MKTKWQTKKLGEVCDFSRGLTYSKKDEVDFSDYIVLRSNNIDLKSCLLDLSDLRYINNKIIISDNKKVRRGSIIICTANGSKSHLGKIALIDDDYEYAFGGFMGQLTPKECIDSKYFFYNLNSSFYKDHLEKISSGANINNLKFSDLQDLEIPLPPLPEQRHIVKILDEVFEKTAEAKENAEKNLQNAEELFESYLQDVFAKPGKDWKEKKLGEACDFMQGIQVDVKFQSETKKENQVRFLRIVDFTQGNELPRYISNPGEKYIIDIDDVSLVRYGASTGFVCRGLSGALANNLFRVIPKNKKEITNDYLFIFLKSPVFQDVIKESMNGAAMPAISFGIVTDIPMSVMPLIEQKFIVKKLDALSAETKKLEVIYKQK